MNKDDAYQTTVKNPVTFSGMTVFSGEESSLTIHPAVANTGIVFDVDGVQIPAHIDFVATGVFGRTALEKEGVSLSMCEHLLGALRGLHIDNALIEVKGSEVPMLDGSAKPYIEAIEKVRLDQVRSQARLSRPIFLSNEGARLIALPADEFSVSYTWYAPYSKAFRAGFWEGEITPQTFCEELAPARTFGFEAQVNQAIEMGLIKGADLERGVLIRDDEVVNPEGLRFEDEIVRHKVLDVIGDLSLIGMLVPMHIIALRSGHAANIKLARALVDAFEKERVNEQLVG